MINQHPITPPLELVQQWYDDSEDPEDNPFAFVEDIANQAARWGADQELEACCEWLGQNCGRWELPAALRVARRPKPQSLKEQAHEALGRFFSNAHTQASEMTQDFEIIRRAVEALPND